MAVLLGALVLPSTAVGAAASTEPCEVVTAEELEEVLNAKFEVLYTDDRTLCSWASEVDGPAVGVDITVLVVPKKTLASAKRFERDEPGARVLKGLGDLAVVSEHTSSPSSPTSRLIVFEGKDVVQVSVTDTRGPSTRRQLRRLGADALARL